MRIVNIGTFDFTVVIPFHYRICYVVFFVVFVFVRMYYLQATFSIDL